MSTTVALVLSLAAVTFAIKAVGPLAFGGRELPGRLAGIITLLAPALLSALIVTQALADGRQLAVGADTAGVIAGGLVAWKTGSIIACVVVAAALTAALRAL